MEIFYEYNTALIPIPQNDLIKYNVKTGDTDKINLNVAECLYAGALQISVAEVDVKRKEPVSVITPA